MLIITKCNGTFFLRIFLLHWNRAKRLIIVKGIKALNVPFYANFCKQAAACIKTTVSLLKQREMFVPGALVSILEGKQIKRPLYIFV